MHLIEELLLASRRWENTWLSPILLIPWRAEEGVAGYRSRVSAIVADMFKKVSALRAHERIAASVFREAYDDTKLADLIRSDSNEAFRAVLRLAPTKRRRQHGCIQARTGSID